MVSLFRNELKELSVSNLLERNTRFQLSSEEDISDLEDWLLLNRKNVVIKRVSAYGLFSHIQVPNSFVVQFTPESFLHNQIATFFRCIFGIPNYQINVALVAPVKTRTPDASLVYQVVQPDDTCEYYYKVVVEAVGTMPSTKEKMEALLKVHMSDPVLDHIIVVKYQYAGTEDTLQMVLAHFYRVGASWGSDLFDIGRLPFASATNWFRDVDQVTLVHEFSFDAVDKPHSFTLIAIHAPLTVNDIGFEPVNLTKDVVVNFPFSHFLEMICAALP